MTTLHLEVLLREHPFIQNHHVEDDRLKLMTLERLGGPKPDAFPSFDLEDEARSFLIPTFVSDNHWMLCVASFPNADDQEGTPEYFESLLLSRSGAERGFDGEGKSQIHKMHKVVA